jgi:uncharacterized delta-60 repeat protein
MKRLLLFFTGMFISAFMVGCSGDNSTSTPVTTTTTPASGSLDTTFGNAGMVTTSIGALTGVGGSSFDNAFSVAIQPDGKLVAAGFVDNQRGFALARYNTDGSLDSGFGTGGKVTTAIATWSGAYSVAIQSDGKIVAAGLSADATYRFTLVRYNTDGTLDTGFGTGGIATTAIGASHAYAYSVAIQSDGKLVASGTDSYAFAIVRYNTDGSLDAGFGSGGIVTNDLGSGFDEARSVVIQSDGKIVVAGDVNDNSRMALVRYNADGSTDNAFGPYGNGLVITDIGTAHNEAYSIALQSDGKIVLAGYSGDGAAYDFALARYNTDGALDPTFGTAGIVTTAIGTGHDLAHSVAIQPDGKIVAAGFTAVSGNKFALVRYNTDGSLDTTFGTGGKITAAPGTSESYAYGIAIRDGKIVIAGYSYNGTDYDFALERYWQ